MRDGKLSGVRSKFGMISNSLPGIYSPTNLFVFMNKQLYYIKVFKPVASMGLNSPMWSSDVKIEVFFLLN
jgi:hypothetical protein